MSINISEAVAKILSEDNKTKGLAEVNDELSGYLKDIKKLVEEGKITYGGLKEEISKYITKENMPKPGSVSQLLLGCMEEEEGWCPLTKEETSSEVSFIYDNETQRFVSLVEEEGDEKNKTATIYLSGDPREIDIDALSELEKIGFKKAKIKHRDVSETTYKELNIRNLEKYIVSKTSSKDIGSNNFMALSFLVVLLLIIYYLKPVSRK